MLEYFKAEDKVSIGVTITDVNNKSKFTGGSMDKSSVKNVKLIEFRR
jgi:hypothetical protein